MKRYAETGSPWHPPFSSLKYDIEILALIIHDSWLSSSILTHLIKPWPNLNLSRQAS